MRGDSFLMFIYFSQSRYLDHVANNVKINLDLSTTQYLLLVSKKDIKKTMKITIGMVIVKTSLLKSLVMVNLLKFKSKLLTTK